MWNDYKHYLIPKNSTYVPGKNAIVQVDQVLDDWGMKKTNPAIFNLRGGKNTLMQAYTNLISAAVSHLHMRALKVNLLKILLVKVTL